MALIAGTLNNASGVRPNTKIILTAYKTTSDVVTLAPDTTIVTSATGTYSFECKPSFYNVRIQQPGYPCENVGIIQVYSDSVDGTINDFLTTFKPDDLTPEILKQCIAAMEGAEAAQKAAEAAASTAAEETAQKVGLMYPVNAGNWSTVAGSQLTEVDRYKAWSYPDNSNDRYAVRGSVTLPITIPDAPDANWYLASSVNLTEMRTDSASQLGGVYKKDYATGDVIPVDAMKNKLMYWHNGQFYSVGTDAGFTSNDFDSDLAAGRFVSDESLSAKSNTSKSYNYKTLTDADNFLNPEWRKLQIVAHTGFGKVFLENTMQAFSGAHKLGADYLEVDVQITSDGHCVVFHDGTTGRLMNQDLTVKTSTLSDLRSLTYNDYQGTIYSQSKIPTLDDLLVWMRNSQAKIWLEIKDLRQESDVEIIANKVNQYGVADKVTFIGNSMSRLFAATDICPNSKFAFFEVNFNQSNLDTISARGNGIYNLQYANITAEVAKACAVARVELATFTSNNALAMKNFQQLGVKYLTTDINLQGY